MSLLRQWGSSCNRPFCALAGFLGEFGPRGYGIRLSDLRVCSLAKTVTIVLRRFVLRLLRGERCVRSDCWSVQLLDVRQRCRHRPENVTLVGEDDPYVFYYHLRTSSSLTGRRSAALPPSDFLLPHQSAACGTTAFGLLPPSPVGGLSCLHGIVPGRRRQSF